MCSGRDDAALPAPGCPIRESAGQSLFSSSPRLIAAVHALLRLLVPRHPPCALHILTVIVRARPPLPSSRWLRGNDLTPARTGDSFVVWPTCAVFKVRGGRSRRGLPAAGLSKLNSTCRAPKRTFRYRLGRRFGTPERTRRLADSLLGVTPAAHPS